MWNAGLDVAQDGIKISRRNINNLRHAYDITLMTQSEEELKSFWMKVKEEREKAGLKSNIQNTKIKKKKKTDVEQWSASKFGKEYVKSVYSHPACLTYMQSTSWETVGWKKHKLESRLPGEISIASDVQMTPPLGQEVKRN